MHFAFFCTSIGALQGSYMYCFGISVSHSVHHSSLFREKRHRKESTVQEAAAHEPTRRRLKPLFTGLETLPPPPFSHLPVEKVKRWKLHLLRQEENDEHSDPLDRTSSQMWLGSKFYGTAKDIHEVPHFSEAQKQKSLGFYIHEEIGANIRRPLYQSLGLTQNPWVTTFMKKSEVTSEETYIRDCSRKHHHWKANASKCK